MMLKHVNQYRPIAYFLSGLLYSIGLLSKTEYRSLPDDYNENLYGINQSLTYLMKNTL